MTPHDPLATALPPELAEVEQLLRAPSPPPPPALLERIHASRDMALVVEGMLLAEEAYASREHRRQRLVRAAAAMVLLAGGVGLWQWRSAPAPAAPGRARVPAPAVAAADELNRLLVPWPAPTRRAAAMNDHPAMRATLSPRRDVALESSTQTLRREVVDASGRVRASTTVRWTFTPAGDGERTAGGTLITQRLSDSTEQAVETDSLMFTGAFALQQRRLHRGDYARFFQFSETDRWVLVADSVSRLRPARDERDRASGGAPSRFWRGAPNASYRTLAGRHPLVVSEAHLALLLRTVPLWEGWELRVAIPSTLDAIAPRYDDRTMTVRVAATVRLTTATDTLNAYRVTLDYGGRPETWWLDVGTGALVRGERQLASGAREITTPIVARPTAR